MNRRTSVSGGGTAVAVAATTILASLTILFGAQPSRDSAFDVVSIKPDTQGFIDLGSGLRLLRGETRCGATDSVRTPGDPLPPAPPGRCVSRNSTVKELIDTAYDLRFGPVRAVLNQMITGGPAWTETRAFDVEAKAMTDTASMQEMRGMLRRMLAERFTLLFHRDRRQITGLALVVAKGGSRLQASEPGGTPGFTAAPIVRGQSVPIVTIVNLLSQRLGQPVADKTGLTGVYDFTLSWTPEPTELSASGRQVVADDRFVGGGLATALREQLGLQLETERIMVEAFVIDSVTMPTPN
jgi:uncharacterized protein (TIGR03435 family)